MPQSASIAPAAIQAQARAGRQEHVQRQASSRLCLARPVRLTSSGSFHAGAPIPSFPTPYDLGRTDTYPLPSPGRSRSVARAPRRHAPRKYHTFPTNPSKTPSDPAGCEASFTRVSRSSSGGSEDAQDGAKSDTDADHDDGHGGGVYRAVGKRRGGRACYSPPESRTCTPLPIKQLVLLALLSLGEQTALNSIGPYLPTMVESFPEIPDDQAGLYVGLLASAFALSQLMTNFLWGYSSDIIGRKPIMLLGTTLLMLCFAFFGFCASYWQVLVVHVAMGLLNGNAAVVPTVLGEVTDRSNQSKAFTWLPVMYSIGGITGPALGGLLVDDSGSTAYPFIGPNMMSAAILLATVVVLGIWFDETLNEADRKTGGLAGLAWVEKLCMCGCFGRNRQGRKGSWSSRWPISRRHSLIRHGQNQGLDEYDGDDANGDMRALLASYDVESQHSDGASNSLSTNKDDAAPSRRSALRQLLNWTTLTILFTYLIFQLANISFNSLYPIFASAEPPTGRGLSPSSIGLTMSFAGLVTILFQISLFEPLKARVGNLGTFRLSLLGLAMSMALIPWVGYKDGNKTFGLGRSSWLFVELGVVLLIKNASAVGGLSCVLLLITNSAPSHETLGTLNGIAQTLSAAGRSIGPFLSGGLFTLSTHIRPKGELLAWGLFGGISLVGWLWSLAISGSKLESGDFVGDDDDDDDDDNDDDDYDFEEREIHEPGPEDERRNNDGPSR